MPDNSTRKQHRDVGTDEVRISFEKLDVGGSSQPETATSSPIAARVLDTRFVYSLS